MRVAAAVNQIKEEDAEKTSCVVQCLKLQKKNWRSFAIKGKEQLILKYEQIA